MGVLGRFYWVSNRLVKAIARWLGVSADAAGAFKRLEGRRLVIYHPQDPIIPYAASLERRVRDLPHQSVRLDLPAERDWNHHVMPLSFYRDAATKNPAMKQIGGFLYGDANFGYGARDSQSAI